MYRKLLFLAAGYIAVAFSFSLYSCGRYDAYICNIAFKGDGEYNRTHDTAVIADTNSLMVTVELKNICYTSVAPRNPFISSTYAFTRCASWKNDFDESSFSLHFDRPLVVGTDTIQPGGNILQRASFNKYARFRKDTAAGDCKGKFFNLRFTKDLLNDMAFDSGVYLATFSCVTTDKRQLTRQLPVRFVK